MSGLDPNNATPRAPISRRPGVRRFFTILIGAIVAGLMLTIGVVLLSDFPGPPQGSADKSGAPPEDARAPASGAG
jgi:hypothetical protein